MIRPVLVLSAAVVLAATIAPSPGAAAAEAWKPTKATKVAEGLEMPVDIAFGPDGWLYYVELFGGNVRRVNPESGNIDPTPVATVKNFNTGVERGVFGLAIDPEFARTRAIYVSYTRNGTEFGGHTVNVLSRFVDGKETVLYERPGNTMHNGGRILVVGEHLYVTTGDTIPIEEWTKEKSIGTAQDEDYVGGKVLRLTRDGKPAPGNPWGNAGFTMGHRNVYGIAYDPATGRLIVTENGSACCDEINLLKAGGNYGWPVCEGPCRPRDARHTDPVVWYNATVGPTGATFFRGDFWFSEFNHGNIHRLRENPDGTWTDDVAHHYTASPPRILDVEAGPDGGTLWFVGWSELWRLDFADDPAHPTQRPPTLEERPKPTPPGDGPSPPTDEAGDPPEENGGGIRIPATTPIAALAAVASAALAAATWRRRA